MGFSDILLFEDFIKGKKKTNTDHKQLRRSFSAYCRPQLRTLRPAFFDLQTWSAQSLPDSILEGDLEILLSPAFDTQKISKTKRHNNEFKI